METRKQQTAGTERRFFSEPIEVRQADGKAPEIFGYALRFGSVYDMGWFTEEIHRDALKNADMEDIRILFNHDVNQVLGRTKAGTAEVGVDSTGMWYRATLPDSPVGQTVKAAIERGDVDQSSWGFTLRYEDDSTGDVWERRNGKDHRTITDVRKVWDASPVTFPANPDTTAAKRSLEFTAQSAQNKTNIEAKAAQIRAAIALSE